MSKSSPNKKYGFDTRAIHGTPFSVTDQFHPLSPPIYLNSSFTFESSDEAASVFAGEQQRFVYGRVHNPTQALLEARLADLEGGEAAMTTASGMGAISSMLLSNLKCGDQIVAHNKMYGNTYNLLNKELTNFGINVVLVDMTDLQQFTSALTDRTKIVFFETPSNPLLELIDIGAVSALVAGNNIKIVVDSTLASPLLLKPLEKGADFVIHSLTKYISGHGDVIGGVIIGSYEDIKNIRMRGLRCLTGATLSPLSCYLVLRGLKTLSVRMQKHSDNASLIANFLENQSEIEKVYFPGLKSHPQFSLAEKYLSQPGGLISFEFKGGLHSAKTFIDKLKLVKRAVSLGDVETLIQHPATMTHSSYTEEELKIYGISSALVRISVGLESAEDIIYDIVEALKV